jgi:hypothetical protein
MKKFGFLSLALLAMVACGGKKNLPDGAPKELSVSRVLSAQEQAEVSYAKLRITGRGQYTNTPSGNSQSFKFEIRLLKDSLIWISVKDPVLGLGIAKGLVTAKEVSYYNSLQRNYFKGAPNALGKEFGFTFSFNSLLQMLSAQLVSSQAPWQLNYLPGRYLLQDYDASGQAPPAPTREVFTDVELEGENFKVVSQTLREPVNGKIYRANYENYQAQNEGYPGKVILEFVQNGRTVIELNINSVERDGGFSFPYKIPGNYAPIR